MPEPTDRDPATLKFLVALGLYVIGVALLVAAAAVAFGPPPALAAAGVAVLVAAGWFLIDSTRAS